MVLNSNSAV